jgi:diaminopimelate epimerase
MPTIPFIKMHGTGNDFIMLDARVQPIHLTSEKVAALANRRTGIGFDQCVVLKASTKADVFMQIINADGSEVNACGNATRCVASLLPEADVTIETNAGIYDCRAAGNDIICVNMGAPKFGWQEIPLSQALDTENIQLDIEGIRNVSGVCVNMGNPHVVFFVDEHAAIDLEEIGPLIEHHPLFPERVNVSVARVIKKHEPVGESAMSSRSDASNESQQTFTETIKLDVWERGAGITLSCGTAACATLVAAALKKLVAPAKAGAYSPLNDMNERMDPRLRADDAYQATIQLPGGDLFIEWEQSTGDVWMTGAVAESFRGSVEV